METANTKKKAHIRTWWKTICFNIYCFLFIFSLHSSIWYVLRIFV